MSDQSMLEAIRSWIEIETQSGDLEGLAALAAKIASDYRALGAEVEVVPGRDGQGEHVIARVPAARPGPNRGILVLSHYDTVHPRGTLKDVPFRVENGRAYGPGIYDMKASAWMAMQAVGAAHAAGSLSLPVTHLIVSDEEVGSPTSQELIRKLASEAAWVLVSEPARDGGKVVVARKGAIRYRAKAHGRPSHAGLRPEDGRSAISEIARLVVAFEAQANRDAGTTVNIGVIGGGTVPNVVPEHAFAEIDIRVTSLAEAERIAAFVAGYKTHDPDVTVTFDGGLNRPPYEDSALTRTLFDIAASEAAGMGIELRGTSSGGGSDGNFTAELVPTLDGMGIDGAGPHTLSEYIEVASISERLELFGRVLARLGRD